MKRIIGILVLLVVVISAIIWFYSTSDEHLGDKPDPLKAIPHDVAMLLETRNVADIWRDLSQSSVIWEELQATDLYFRLNAVGQLLDSAMRDQAELRKYLDHKSLVISVHSSGARNYSFLLCMPITGQSDLQIVTDEVTKLLRPQDTPVKKTYDGVTLTSFKPAFIDQNITFYASDGILAISLNTILAEESIRALKQGSNVLSDASFVQVRRTIDPQARGQIYLNHSKFAAIVKPFASSFAGKSAYFQSAYASWSALDLSMKSNSISLNGFVQATDSGSMWLANLAGLKAPEIKVLNYMPSNTAYFSYYGIGDFEAFHKRVTSMREARGTKFKLDNLVTETNARCSCDIEKLTLGWLGAQMAHFITEPANEDYASHQFAIMQTLDKALADESLEKLSIHFPAENNEDSGEKDYDGHVIRRLNIGTIYGHFLGDAYTNLDNPYVARIDDMVLMANSLNGLRTLLQNVESQKTLAVDEGFKGLADQISAEAHFVMYSAMSRSPFLYKALLAEEQATALESRKETVRKFQGLVYQVSHHKNDLYYNNIYFKHNPIYQQETSALWEAKLKADLIGEPHLVKNHYTGALEVLAQDIENRLYLISNTGKILWETALDGPVLGEVKQVDVLKNRKLQMVLGTKDKLYLLDRNGNSMDGFPISLPAKASAAVAVVDYDNSRDYRFFVPLENGKVMAWDARGKAVEGWSFADKEAAIIAPIEHIRVRSKDYIFAVNAKGKIHLLDRKGSARHDVELRVPPKSRLPYTVEHPEQVIGGGAVHVLDSLGVAYRIGFDNRLAQLNLGIKGIKGSRFVDLDKNGSLDCLIITSEGIQVLNSDGARIMDIAQADLSSSAGIITLNSGETLISASGAIVAKVHLYTMDGQPLEGFPLVGELLPVVGDMNGDGNYNLVTGMRNGYLYGYAIHIRK